MVLYTRAEEQELRATVLDLQKSIPEAHNKSTIEYLVGEQDAELEEEINQWAHSLFQDQFFLKVPINLLGMAEAKAHAVRKHWSVKSIESIEECSRFIDEFKQDYLVMKEIVLQDAQALSEKYNPSVSMDGSYSVMFYPIYEFKRSGERGYGLFIAERKIGRDETHVFEEMGFVKDEDNLYASFTEDVFNPFAPGWKDRKILEDFFN